MKSITNKSSADLIDFYSGQEVPRSFIDAENAAFEYACQVNNSTVNRQELVQEKYLFCIGQTDHLIDHLIDF